MAMAFNGESDVVIFPELPHCNWHLLQDVVFVVDAGRSRTTFFNEQTMISALRTVWYSKANGFQRRGRAGRCRPGVWYRLYTKLQWEAMDEYELPEMQRSPLEELCLEVPEAADDRMYININIYIIYACIYMHVYIYVYTCIVLFILLLLLLLLLLFLLQ